MMTTVTLMLMVVVVVTAMMMIDGDGGDDDDDGGGGDVDYMVMTTMMMLTIYMHPVVLWLPRRLQAIFAQQAPFTLHDMGFVGVGDSAPLCDCSTPLCSQVLQWVPIVYRQLKPVVLSYDITP